jgi:hypothetical protein
MLEDIGDLLLDLVKYVSTALLVFPLLDGLEKDWHYYTFVGCSVGVVAVVGLALKHFGKNKRNHKNKNKKKRK